MTTFKDLPDGALFQIAITYAYGSKRVFQKVMEDSEHNAVWQENTNIGELIPHNMRVIPVYR